MTELPNEHSRYIIGIDLGTTNSSIAYVDTDLTTNPSLAIQTLPIPQQGPSGLLEKLSSLPSFCYLFTETETTHQQGLLPWQKKKGWHTDYSVGAYALSRGEKAPMRMVSAAKSWLCHAAADRKEAILPFEAQEQPYRISPIVATSRYLLHIREAWNATMPDDAPFEEQEVIVTVPASFDEIARSLTAEAAAKAGFCKMTLLEEPQAAFYAWIAKNSSSWQQKIRPGEVILVCDVGGGTTDFSLIIAKSNEQGLSFQRMAVGKHLLLGGENMDASIAHYAEQKLRQESLLHEQQELSSEQWLKLCQQARQAKEFLLTNDNNHTNYSIVLQSSGSSVVGKTLTTELERQPIIDLLFSGFFGSYHFEEALKIRKTQGLRAMGLPFEDEPSIIKQLANFLSSAEKEGQRVAPDYILFNGGTMKPLMFQEAVINNIKNWFPEKSHLQTLHSESLDLAVARGAAYYGKARRGLGVRIASGSPRTLYLGIKDNTETLKALTLMPRDSQEGQKFSPKEKFQLLSNTPVAFQLYSSHTRLNDKAGDLVTIEEETMQPLPSIQTVLRYGKNSSQKALQASLEAFLTPIGTIDLHLCSQESSHRWKLEFQLRDAAGQEDSLAIREHRQQDETFDEGFLENAKKIVTEIFDGKRKPKELMPLLEECLQRKRELWSPSILRGLWDSVLAIAPKRMLSPAHQSRFWNITGYVLRPGFGYPLDDHRIKALWKILLADGSKSKNVEIQIQKWICLRRIAGGLNRGQQEQLASDILGKLLPKKGQKISLKGKSEEYQYQEQIRTLAAMEHLPSNTKERLGDMIVSRILSQEAFETEYWALGRLGARELVYGTLTSVIATKKIEKWLQQLFDNKTLPTEKLSFIVSQLARKTDYRELNISQAIVDKAKEKVSLSDDAKRLEELLTIASTLSAKEQDTLLGDSLPIGISLNP